MASSSGRSSGKQFVVQIILLLLGLIAIVPIYLLLLNSTRTTEQINSGIAVFPGKDAFSSSTSTITAKWDSYEQSGILRYADLVMGKTLKEENGQKIVVKSFTESTSPRLVVVNDNDDIIATFNLTNGTVLFASDGQRVNKGANLAKRVTLPNVRFNWGVLTGRGFQIWQGFGNSAFVAICTTVLCVYFSAMTAYGLHIYRFKGRAVLWSVILVIIMLPATLSIIGFVQFVGMIRLRDSYIPLIIPSIASAGTVLFLRQYMMSAISIELIDAARIEGADEYRIFNSISLPVMLPALAAQSIFVFVGTWNSFITPSVLISTQSKYTLPLLVRDLAGNIYRAEVGAIYLGVAISLIPIILFYAFMSRYIISGITMGGLKE
jgi:ABC-type glycerol-3-phosphate transport system permease component